jgi:hypothetical protein
VAGLLGRLSPVLGALGVNVNNGHSLGVDGHGKTVEFCVSSRAKNQHVIAIVQAAMISAQGLQMVDLDIETRAG